MKDLPRVFIGFDPHETVAHHVLASSIQRLSSVPVAIAQIALHQLRDDFNRPRHELQSNDFSFSRWLVPHLCNYSGWALWLDCDMLFFDDIAKLWALRDNRYAVQVVKHKHVPRETTKYLGNQQTAYERKNWSSVMLMNCAKCRKLTADYVEIAPGLDLHQFKWLPDGEIGELPHEWNYLVGYDTLDTLAEPVKNAHFTIGGPYFREYYDCEFAKDWRTEYWKMLYCDDPPQDMKRS